MAEVTDAAPNDINISTIRLLETLHQMITDVNEINGTNEKIARLCKYPELRAFLKLLYDPLQTTGVTSSQVRKYKPTTTIKKRKAVGLSDENMKQIDNLVELIEKLYSRELSGNNAKNQIQGFIEKYPTYELLIYKIIDKDLETRLDVKQINNAFPNLISEFSVALAKDFESGQSYFTKNAQTGWFISRKYDGIRCIVKVTNNTAMAFSRNGNRLSALAPLEELISRSAKNMKHSFVLDGEVCALDANGLENFAEAVSQAKRKSVRMENYRYYIFDMLTLGEFESAHASRKLSLRLDNLQSFVKLVAEPNHLQMVTQTLYSEESFKLQQIESAENSWEGLMLRMDSDYKGKRSSDILKVKNFQTEEYVVQGFDTTSIRMIHETTGLEHTVPVLKSVHILHKGNIVHVGSGFNFDERRKFFENPNLIVGKTISVKFFEESKDSSGKVSLRFPIFTALHGQKRLL